MDSLPLVLIYKQHDNTDLPKVFSNLINQRMKIVWFEEFEKDEEKFAQQIESIIIFIGKPKITESFLDRLPCLKVIANIGVGYNHVNVPMVRKRGIRFSNTPDVLNMATAEQGMALMLASARNIVKYAKLTCEQNFTSLNQSHISTMQVSNATLGIIGMGRIGLTLAKMARGFNMTILYHSRNKSLHETDVQATHYSNLNDMLPQCDFVVICVCLTPQTKHILSTEQFSCMKNSATIINISRGETIDQEALVNALDQDQILGAALDVTTPEPLPCDHPLLNNPKVIITPHTGSATMPTRCAMTNLAVDNALAVLNGEKMPSEVFE